MIRLRSLAICSFIIAAVSPAQNTPPPPQTPTVAVSLALDKDHVPAGQKLWAILTIENITHSTYFSTSSHLYRIHVEGKDGEPRKTELYRHMLGDFRPGDGPELMDGPDAGLEIAPGTAKSHSFDLTSFYDLGTPGEYTVYLDYMDFPNGPSKPGVWLRTNTANFKIDAPPR